MGHKHNLLLRLQPSCCRGNSSCALLLLNSCVGVTTGESNCKANQNQKQCVCVDTYLQAWNQPLITSRVPLMYLSSATGPSTSLLLPSTSS